MPDSEDSITLVSFAAGERGYFSMLATAASGVTAVITEPDGKREFSSSEPLEPGRAKLEGEDGPLDLSWTPAGPLLEFSIGIPAVRVYAVAATAGLARRPRRLLGAAPQRLLRPAHGLGGDAEARPGRARRRPPR